MKVIKIYIYTLTDPITNQIRYVGKTNNIVQRYKAHLNKAKRHQKHMFNWINALKKEGLKPIMEIIDVVSIEEWKFWEQYWISQLKTWGFKLINYTNGGDGCTFANQTSYKKGQGGKKVIGFNSMYEKIYEFNSAIEASKFLKVNKSSISCCCCNNCRRKTVKNIAWFYYDDIIDLNENDLKKKIKENFIINRNPNSNTYYSGKLGPRAKKVLMFDLDWNFICEFESATSAAKFIGVTNGAIQFACTKSKKSKCKNYKWKYYEK